MLTFAIGDVLVDIRIALVSSQLLRMVLCRNVSPSPPSDWKPSRCSGPLHHDSLSGQPSLLASGPRAHSESSIRR